MLFIMGLSGEEPDEEEQRYKNPHKSVSMAKLNVKSLSEKQEAKAKSDVGNDGDAPPH